LYFENNRLNSEIVDAIRPQEIGELLFKLLDKQKEDEPNWINKAEETAAKFVTTIQGDALQAILADSSGKDTKLADYIICHFSGTYPDYKKAWADFKLDRDRVLSHVATDFSLSVKDNELIKISFLITNNDQDSPCQVNERAYEHFVIYS